MKGHEKAAVELAWVFYMTFSHVEILLSFLVYPDQNSETKKVTITLFLFYFMAKTNKQNCHVKAYNSKWKKSELCDLNSEFWGEKLEFWVYMYFNVYFVLF